MNLWLSLEGWYKPNQHGPPLSLNMEPDNSQLPDSGWRWGIAVIGDRGRVRVMPLQSGARASLRVQRQRADIAYFLVVMGAPMSLQQIFWDQVFYSVYRPGKNKLMAPCLWVLVRSKCFWLGASEWRRLRG